jgi:hypothetical protein
MHEHNPKLTLVAIEIPKKVAYANALDWWPERVFR